MRNLNPYFYVSTITAEESSKIVDSRVEQAVMSSPLMHIEGFLLALTNPDKDGRIVINKKSKTAQPIKHLQETKIQGIKAVE